MRPVTRGAGPCSQEAGGWEQPPARCAEPGSKLARVVPVCFFPSDLKTRPKVIWEGISLKQCLSRGTIKLPSRGTAGPRPGPREPGRTDPEGHSWVDSGTVWQKVEVHVEVASSMICPSLSLPVNQKIKEMTSHRRCPHYGKNLVQFAVPNHRRV